MYNVAICISDQKLFSEVNVVVHDTMETFHIKHNILSFGSGKLLTNKISTEKIEPDLLIIDVQLSDANGIEIIKSLRKDKIKSRVIYLSCDKNSAYDAITSDVFRFILKDNLTESLSKAIFLDYKRNHQQKHFPLKLGGLTKKIKVSSVLYLETFKRGTNMYYDNQSIYIPTKLSSFFESLPQDIFYRCHFSFAVNIKKVVAVKRYEAILEDGKSIPISKTRYDDIKQTFLNYLSL